MKINVCQLKKDRGASLEFRFQERAGAVLPAEFVAAFLGDVTVEGKVTNLGTGLLAQGRARAKTKDSCARCLKELACELAADFSEEFLLGGVQLAAGETYSYKDDLLDLKELAAETLLAAQPFRRLCHDACKGLCPVCGADLNGADCGCVPAPDPRLAALKEQLAGEQPIHPKSVKNVKS